ALLGLICFDDESAGMATNGNSPVRPGAQKGGAHWRVRFHRACGTPWRPLAGDNHSRLRPPGQLRCVWESAPVMRCHQDIGMNGIERQDRCQARALQVAGQEQSMSCMANQEHQTAGVFVPVWSKRGWVEYFEAHFAGPKSISRANCADRHAVLFYGGQR